MGIDWEKMGNLRMTLARDFLYELRFCALVAEPIAFDLDKVLKALGQDASVVYSLLLNLLSLLRTSHFSC